MTEAMIVESCVLCKDDPVDHAPYPDRLCAACGEPYEIGCKREHHHSSWTCFDIQDIRALPCGCYAHKECSKSGGVCREHLEATG